MMEQDNAQWDRWLAQQASAIDFPETPDLGSAVRRRLERSRPAQKRVAPLMGGRLAWATLLVLLLGALLLVPDVRAGISAWLRAGAITILVGGEEPSAVLPPARPLLANAVPSSVQDIRAAFPQAELTEQFPTTLGQPDLAYVDAEQEPQVGVLVWLEAEQSDEVAWSLYLIKGEDFGIKLAEVVEITPVNNADGFWIEGPHPIRLQDGSTRSWQLVEGNVLVWWEQGMTYRLEGASSLDDAVRLAEELLGG